MPMLKIPSQKYETFNGPDLPNRQWPSKKITKAPRWLSTDLRDGNQSLANPMTISQKWTFFKLLVQLGYKEIEVSMPVASTIDYEFTRQLIETPGAVPEDVTLQWTVCAAARKVVLSLYISADPVFLNEVLGMSQEQVYERAVESVTYAKQITKDDPAQRNATEWILMFSPEAFTSSDLHFCLRLCEAAKAIWQPTVAEPMIMTLAATVEMSTPNVYADQVELFSKSLTARETVVLGLHVHNDRGCAVAAAELGLLAGAQRVEGCLFGNGERSGNVDLVTLALNLYSQGIDPGVDFSDLAAVRAVVEGINRIPVHPRAPYAGDLIYTAYSGAHQDAISKCLSKRGGRSEMMMSSEGHQAQSSTGNSKWKIPYLPLDPEDLGLSQDDIIRLNSQSGKGGVAWALVRELGLQQQQQQQQQPLSQGLLANFSKVVKKASEKSGGVISQRAAAELFYGRYCLAGPDPRIVSVEVVAVSDELPPGPAQEFWVVNAVVKLRGTELHLQGKSTNTVAALTAAFREHPRMGGEDFTFEVSRCGTESTSKKASGIVVVECSSTSRKQSGWGVRHLAGSGHPETKAALSAALDLLQDL
ncbi:2-isopropylmalate synthase [Apiospora marii]|uniref:2-isopropylmalate synthase n=1 Tax=Apiospora marii TaxID=335849 RepID=A0ABR1R8F0_9PEZI